MFSSGSATKSPLGYSDAQLNRLPRGLSEKVDDRRDTFMEGFSSERNLIECLDVQVQPGSGSTSRLWSARPTDLAQCLKKVK